MELHNFAPLIMRHLLSYRHLVCQPRKLCCIGRNRMRHQCKMHKREVWNEPDRSHKPNKLGCGTRKRRRFFIPQEMARLEDWYPFNQWTLGPSSSRLAKPRATATQRSW